ncbi:MAG: hypothetical protein CVU56_03265 [Deltaproteobacteria bacterium HGW-Deltaproteobacteria-14]|nr:MAG: hypothetical protein CVU56_03265 [Deltaproteobacteria bacterium HGW-Deltaproteobacteria-14]
MPAYPPPPEDAPASPPEAATSPSARPNRPAWSQRKSIRRVTRPELHRPQITLVDQAAAVPAEPPSAPSPLPARTPHPAVYGGAGAEERAAPREGARVTTETKA